ncbi:LOW QUALITY PROTEIN: long-chain fatty acid transport protein 6-like [Saccoglossus kowalevskii]
MVLDISLTSAVATGTVVVAAAFMRKSYPYWRRDALGLIKLLSVAKPFRNHIKRNRFMSDLFEQAKKRNPEKACLVFQDRTYSYEEIDRLSNKFANFARNQVKTGDTMAHFMYNEPAFIWTWLGCAKLGVKSAFINYNLRDKSLVHCINLSKANILVIGEGSDLKTAIADVVPQLNNQQLEIWMIGDKPELENDTVTTFRSVNEEIADASENPISSHARHGLPKAARVSHYRLTLASFVLTPFGLQSDDRIYLALPLYHSTAFGMGLGNTFRLGATAVLSSKFSASNFWKVCCKYDITAFFYVGELCRYLVNAPQNQDEKNHKVRLALGNGLRPDVWTQFSDRFKISAICEFYGATDSNFFTANDQIKVVGSIGQYSPFLQKLRGFHIIKYNPESEEPLRDENGRCIQVSQGEPGLLINPINIHIPFDGYVGNKQLTEKKIIRNVFKTDDAYFNTGDLLYMDEDYNLYFYDRVGDTFRWKGENVATTEVAETITRFPGVKEAIVYGVNVPGYDGKAGMAAVILSDQHVNLQEMYSFLSSRLPMYSCPRFIRITKELVITGTYKYTKLDLVKEGFNPDLVSDPLYYFDSLAKSYTLLDHQAFEKIEKKEIRL